jgi:phosphopantetheine--protein transferase-like protein
MQQLPAALRLGIDMVSHSRFRKKISGRQFREKVFHPSELRNPDVKKLAGIFAVKEAAFKALGIPAGNWLEIEVRKLADGKPELLLSHEITPKNLVSLDCSISHEGGFTVGAVIALLGNHKKHG